MTQHPNIEQTQSWAPSPSIPGRSTRSTQTQLIIIKPVGVSRCQLLYCPVHTDSQAWQRFTAEQYAIHGKLYFKHENMYRPCCKRRLLRWPLAPSMTSIAAKHRVYKLLRLHLGFVEAAFSCYNQQRCLQASKQGSSTSREPASHPQQPRPAATAAAAMQSIVLS
jgi:hypothetical protein